MTERQRQLAVRRLRRLLNEGIHRKQAFLTVIDETRARGFPCSQTSLYAWCAMYDVSTR